MSEPFVGREMSEELESSEQLEASARELTEMTNEPGSYIEGRIEVDHSEVIETSFTELANNQVTESGEIQMPACDGSSRTTETPANGNEEASIMPLPTPGDAKESPNDIIENLPIPMPIDPPESNEGEDVGFLPTPLPYEANEIGRPVIEVKVTGEVPVSFDGSAVSIIGGSKLASIDPDPIWMDPDPFSSESASKRSDPGEEIGLIGENG